MVQIINGRWVDENHNPLDERNCSELTNLGKKVKAIYGGNITHDRIVLINQLSSLEDNDERILNRIINEGHLEKLIGV